MENEFDYYVLERDGSDAYPLIICDDDSEHTEEYVYDYREIIIPEPQEMEFTFGEPYFKNPVIGDYFSQPNSVISAKIQAVLEPMNIHGIQLIPAVVSSNKGDIYEDYYYIHIYNHIKAIDLEHSKYTQGDGMIFIQKFKFDNTILENIPINERLIFRMKESHSRMIYHKSVVDAVMAVNPTGLQFTKVEDWCF